MSGWEDDNQFDRATVGTVTAERNGWSVTRRDGWSIFVPSNCCPIEPRAGEQMRCYGRGIGFSVRGIVIGGRCYRYQTEREEEAEHQDQAAAQRQKRALAHQSSVAEKNERITRLSAPFRARFAHFHEHRGDTWRAEHEPYELFVCEQASALVDALVTNKALIDFAQMPHVNQKETVPAWDDGHSGNTASAAIYLAQRAIRSPALVPKMHGALCPLVGCADYGCFAATAEEKPAVDNPEPSKGGES